MSIAGLKANLVQELFLRTADENYVTARWCAINRLNTDFLWLSVHCLEKYMKAVLLLNGRSSKGFGHNVENLYGELLTFASDLLPLDLVRPPNLEIYHWRDRTPAQFMAHLHSNGNADNRYLIYGHSTASSDLHMLDQMVFTVRRLIHPLDERVFRQGDAPQMTFREALVADPAFYFTPHMPLDALISANGASAARHAALNLNLSFAPDDYPHEPIQGGSSAVNPVIVRRILDPLESSDASQAAVGIELARWLLDNVQIPRGKATDPGVVEQIEAAILAARERHGLGAGA